MIKNISTIILALFMFTSCESFVDVFPDNVATIEYAFRDKVGAEKFLASCYTYLPNEGDINADPALLGSNELWTFLKTVDMTDNFPFDIKIGLQNASSPYNNYWSGANNGKALFQGIRNCNYFLDNVDLVGPELSSEEKARWKGEAKFIKAYLHFYLLRMYGPIPLIKTSLPISSDIEDVRVYRDPFDDCVMYISQLLEEATVDLPFAIADPATQMGRITKPIALSVKAKLLAMAASPLFNGNPDYANVKDNRGIYLFPSNYVQAKWDSAAVAAKRAIDASELAGNKLYKFVDQAILINDTTRQLQSLRGAVSDRWNEEIIWGNSRTFSYEYSCLPYLNTNHQSFVAWKPMLAPTLEMAEKFYSKNGVPIDEDNTYDYTNRYNTATSTDKFYVQPGFRTAILNLNREPRFYANLGFDGGYWFGNNEDATLRPTENNTPLMMKQGQRSGKVGSLRFTLTGYWAKKPCNYKTVMNGTSHAIVTYKYAFPVIRLADMYLLYAEALNESKAAPDASVYEYIDKVRTRAGLKGIVESWTNYSKYGAIPTTTKDGMREIIQRERAIELCFEGKHFWDIRRWKTAVKDMNASIVGWNVDANTEGDYYRIIPLADISFSTKNYLWPIKSSDLRINKNTVQNPYW